MYKLKFSLLIFAFFYCNISNGQHRNDLEAGLFNIGFGGIIGGVGSIIHKKPTEKLGKVIIKGFIQGAIGGYFVFESKRLVGEYAKTGNYIFLWPSKIVNNAGTSIIENAAANRNFWSRWHLNIGFNRLEIQTDKSFKLTYRIMPFSLVSTLYHFTEGKLDISESARIGNFVFKTDKKIRLNQSYFTDGRVLANTIILNENPTLSSQEIIFAHEIIHTFQYESFSGINVYLDKPISKLKSSSILINKYHKLFYTDYNFIIKGGLILMQSDHDKNFFENEARYYTELYKE